MGFHLSVYFLWRALQWHQDLAEEDGFQTSINKCKKVLDLGIFMNKCMLLLTGFL